MPTLQLGQEIETVRCPELPLYSSYGPLTTSDYTFWWLAAFNKTVKVDAQSLYTFFQTGGGGSLPPVVLGDKVIKVVSSSEAGGTELSVPELAGKNFFLERDGYPLLLTEFEILNAGGCKLITPGDVLIEGQRFVFHVYELQGGSSSGSSAKPLIQGEVQVSTNTVFDTVNHVNKLIQIRGGASRITFTLPLVDDIPDYTIIPIEATITNSVEQKIMTQGGQSIYINLMAKNSIYLRAGEVVWLYRADDGYYIINDFGTLYRSVGDIKSAYKVGLNELLLKGQELSRADYPRLWEWIQTLGSSLVTDAQWLTASETLGGKTIPYPYRGCFSSGNGTTTFRLPDLMNMFLRGLKNEGGSDTERFYNKPGGYQKADTMDMGGKDDANPTDGVDTGLSYAAGAAQFKMRGYETRPENIGVYWVIKC